jgi:hypothetical protein
MLACGSGGGAETSSAAWARTDVTTQTSSSFIGARPDGLGNVYAIGTIFGPGSLDFGDGVTAGAASSGEYPLLMKYDASGTPQWAQTPAGGSARFSSLVLDSSGAAYVSGCLGGPGSVDFGNGVTLTKSDAFQNALLVKYDAGGLAQWARAVVDGGSDSIFSELAIDATGSVYAVGDVSGTAPYDLGGGITFTGVANADGYMSSPDTAILVKYDSSGVAQWANGVVAGSPASSFTSVAVSAAGDLYTAGTIAGKGTYDFGNGVTVAGSVAYGGPLAGDPGYAALLVKYDSNGVAQWGRSIGATYGFSSFSSVAVDSAGNSYAAGVIADDTYDLGNGVTVAGSLQNGVSPGFIGAQYLMLSKYDLSGVAQWARTVNPGGSNSYLNSVAVDASDNVYIAGAVDSTGIYDFGNGVRITTAEPDPRYYAALVKYDPSGTAQWARSAANGGSSAEILGSVAVDSSGSIYSAGVVAGPGEVDFGNGVSIAGAVATTAGYGWSALLVKYR